MLLYVHRSETAYKGREKGWGEVGWGGVGDKVPPEVNSTRGTSSQDWDVPLVEFMHLVFTRTPGESYCRQLRSLLLYLCYVFRALINSLVC